MEIREQACTLGFTSLTCREEGEKFNVWVAWLNLENLYGEPAEEAVMGLFRKALAANPQKALYMALINILERSQKVCPVHCLQMHPDF